MPNKDGTGPNGQGSRTGRGMGDCNKMPKSSDSNLDERNVRGVRNGKLNGRRMGRGRFRD